MSTRVLLVGSGGREHALAWKLAQSSLVSQIFVVPGNGGTAGLGSKVCNVDNVSADDFAQLLEFAIGEKINLLVPGPEAPLVDGIVDYFRQHGPATISCFGPSKAAARLEGSKAFAKDFMLRHKIPTAAYTTFESHDQAVDYLMKNQDKRFVVKASGLAAGKGVVVPSSHEEAVDAVTSIMLDRTFGAAGDSVVLEEFLEGEELSVLSFCDGYTIQSLPGAQDHKRLLNGDQGPNTGGMGCYAPSPAATPTIMERIYRETLLPTVNGMRQEGFPMVGCLFTGYILTKDGPKLLEYNVRFGDPECQTLLPLLESDIGDIMLKCSGGWLDGGDLQLSRDFSATVVVAAGGYPGKYDKGLAITINEVPPDSLLFHAGTVFDSSRTLRTSGGRVIASTATGSSIKSAVEKAYKGVSCIRFDRMHYRDDIAYRALHQTQATDGHPSHIPVTYASTGVSIDAGNCLVNNIKPLVQATARPGADALIGGFGGEISLPKARYPSTSPTIVAAIDGIGTKIMVAIAVSDYSTVGIDLVAMNVNDLIVQGAEPLAFLDYYACSKLDVAAATSFVQGVAKGCKQAECALIGGETAEMPGLYKGVDFDAAGTAIGAIQYDKQPLPNKIAMQKGDVVLGIASTGPHSNGYSLIRKLVERAGLSYESSAPWDSEDVTVGRSLLTPTRIYVKSVMTVLNNAELTPHVLGFAHITGGGLVENIPRMLPDHLAARLEIGSWHVPEIFHWLKSKGIIENAEMARAFNMGLGMVCVVREEAVAGVIRSLQCTGETVFTIGSLIEREENSHGCILQGLEKWDICC